jgi:hypothetical protein
MISWNSVSGANYYYLYRSTSWFGDYYYVTSTSGTSYTDTGLSSSTTYYYKVSTISNGGESSLSNSYGYATTYSSYTDINGGWYYCTLSAGEYQYYRLYVYAGYTYDIIWEDYDYDSSLCDIEVSATWQNSGVEIFPPIDYDSASFYASSSGYVILKVKGRYDSSSGTYYIYSSTAVQM